jgi:NAD(P)-dependent dehydrogenase (short-subunit alcohol dehydrogenase family)
MTSDGFPTQALRGGVVITGGASGIGRATGLRCAHAGASVALLDTNGPGAEEVAEQALAAGAPAAIGIECDVRSEEAVSRALAHASEKISPIRGLFACAGVYRAGMIHEVPTDEWLDVLNINLLGTFFACKYTLQAMLEHGEGGSIVCTSSPWATVGAPGGGSAYSASKGAISAFVRSAAFDYAPDNIRVNAVIPGATDTALMWAEVPEADQPAVREKLNEQLPMGRLGTPEEVAEGIAWLLSDQASYVTASHLMVDGGLLARAGIDE